MKMLPYASRLVCLLAALVTLPLNAVAQKGLQVSWASKDVHYAQTEKPNVSGCTDTLITAWKGERVNVEAVLYAADNAGDFSLRAQSNETFLSTESQTAFLGYVITDNYQYCGQHPHNLTPYSVPDVLDTLKVWHATKHTAQPVWYSFDVPHDIKDGTYRSQLHIIDVRSGKPVHRLRLTVKVLDRELTAPKDQAFHVDFWQQPYAVSRWLNVPRWSKEHIDALRPYLKLLARSGQKVVSAILFYEPWGDQSYDKFDPMVKTTKKADGTWSYDYSIFDQWVELCAQCGINRQINCFSMVPWDMTFRYFDEAAGRDVDLQTQTSSSEYRTLWASFLKSFAAHLKEKGWFEKTCIAMDERGLNNMLDAYKVAQEAVPGLNMALAGTYHAELVDKLKDYCIGYGEEFTDAELAARKAKGWVSTTYTCCSNTEPNLFTNSLPAEAAYLPVFSVANGFDGYLRWAWMNWDDKSDTDSRYRLFAPGDTYLVYPGVRSSVRYERFIEGVAMAEKIRLLRLEYQAKHDETSLQRLNAIVKQFKQTGKPEGETYSSLLNKLQTELNREKR